MKAKNQQISVQAARDIIDEAERKEREKQRILDPFEWQDQCSKLMFQNKTLHAALDQTWKQLNTAYRQIADLEEEKEDLIGEVVWYRNEMETLQSEKEECDAKVASLEGEIEELKAHNSDNQFWKSSSQYGFSQRD